MRPNVDRCSEWRSLASCRLDRELDELRTARLERHLLGCAACRTWAHEVAALAGLLRDAEPALPARPLELRTRALRRRLARASAAGLTAASAAAAAVAALVVALPGSGISPFSSGSAQVVSAAPCASCMKKQAVTVALESPQAVAGPVHVANPLMDRIGGGDTP